MICLILRRIKFISAAVISIFWSFVISGCANFTSKNVEFKYESDRCIEPIYVEANGLYYPPSGNQYEIRTDNNDLITYSHNHPVPGEKDFIQDIQKILSLTEQMTGCKFTLDKSEINSHRHIRLNYTTNAQKEKNGLGLWISALTLTIVPYKMNNQDTLVGDFEIGNKIKKFSYVEDSSLYMGLLMIPLVPFSELSDQRIKNLAIKLANDLCELSSECRIRN